MNLCGNNEAGKQNEEAHKEIKARHKDEPLLDFNERGLRRIRDDRWNRSIVVTAAFVRPNPPGKNVGQWT